MNRVSTKNATPSFLSVLMLAFAAFVLCACQSGCVSAWANLVYVIKGKDNPAEFDELKEKKVAVVVTHNGLHTWDATSVILARNLNLLLGSRVKKINMIGQDLVEGICQDQPIGNLDAGAIGSRLGADYVIHADISDLKLREGQTLFQGRSTSSVLVYKVGESAPVFRKSLPEFVFPTTGAPVTEMDESTFQRAYLTLVAGRIGRHFYPYDPSEDVAQDAAIASISGFQ